MMEPIDPPGNDSRDLGSLADSAPVLQRSVHHTPPYLRALIAAVALAGLGLGFGAGAVVFHNHQPATVGHPTSHSCRSRGHAGPRALADVPVRQTWLGLLLDADDNDGEGALVKETVPDSPAAAAQIRPGDRITAIGINAGDVLAPVMGAQSLISQVRGFMPGTDVTIELDRAGEKMTVQATLSSMPIYGQGHDYRHQR